MSIRGHSVNVSYYVDRIKPDLEKGMTTICMGLPMIRPG